MADNESVARSFFEDLCNGRKRNMAPELMTANHAYHDPNVAAATGPEGMVEALRPFQDSLNGHWEVHDVLPSGDRVAVRWTGSGDHTAELMGIPPTGKHVEVEAMSVMRFEGGKIAEHWAVWDTLGMLRQLGVVPAV